MQLRRRRTSVALLAILAALFIALLAAPARAELKQGACTGDATFSSTGQRVDQNTPESTVILVPREDDVTYNGTAARAPADANSEIGYSGGVSAKIGPVWISIVSWSGNAQPGEDSVSDGTYSYDIPSVIPGTGEIKVRATHKHGSAEECIGVWTMKLDGGPGVVGLVAAAGTVLFGALLVTSGIAKKGT